MLFSGKFSGSSSVRKELSIKKVHFLRPSQANFFSSFGVIFLTDRLIIDIQVFKGDSISNSQLIAPSKALGAM